MLDSNLADQILAKYSSSITLTIPIRPMARNSSELRMLLEGTLPEGGICQSGSKNKQKYLSAKETASFLGISSGSVIYYTKKGKIQRDGSLYVLASVKDFQEALASGNNKRKSFSLDERQKIEILAIMNDEQFAYSGKNGKSLAIAAKEYGVSSSSLRRLLRKESISPKAIATEWSSEELQTLTDLSKRYKPRSISVKMKEAGFTRSSNAVYKKISLMNLKQDDSCSEEYSVNKLANLLNLNHRIINKEVEQLGKKDTKLICRADAINIAEKYGVNLCRSKIA